MTFSNAFSHRIRAPPRVSEKIVFEPSTEIIRKGKVGKPNEFGKMIRLQEAENQIVYVRRPNDWDLLIPAIQTHQAKLGAYTATVATDGGFYSAGNEAAAKATGVKRVCIPNRSSKSSERRREQKKRWFRNGQKWRTGWEGRISVVKRRCPWSEGTLLFVTSLQSGRRGRDDEGVHRFAEPEAETIRQGEG
jgi:transposase, IS5 family